MEIIEVNGIQLEGSLERRSTATSEGKLAVCLHPWSWLGGRMNDPVLASLKPLLRQKGYHILLYNSRGVGRSTGRASLTGSPEVDDLQAVVHWALDRLGDIQSVLLVGYSYGALIASSLPLLSRPLKTSHLLISYPVSVRGFLTLFRSGTYASKLSELLRDNSSRVMVVYGDCDDFTGAGRYRAWQLELEKETSATLTCVCVQGANHFWGSDRASAQLLESVESWVD
ncbi:alpha/beta-hydrolase [Pterulicium gracile]|uniref:Alpha/beta-hydrolase n=1 Tax=Pterulicium gracile TaxID=1884261 RepID=A0A5C3R039_9AGAR|nr:alpha/beta-hydrolase [Pterula gracilis]